MAESSTEYADTVAISAVPTTADCALQRISRIDPTGHPTHSTFIDLNGDPAINLASGAAINQTRYQPLQIVALG